WAGGRVVVAGVVPVRVGEGGRVGGGCCGRSLGPAADERRARGGPRAGGASLRVDERLGRVGVVPRCVAGFWGGREVGGVGREADHVLTTLQTHQGRQGTHLLRLGGE